MIFLSLTVASWATGNFAKSDLSGTWNITLHGNTGCGLIAMLVNTTLIFFLTNRGRASSGA
jgi:hypothetical protein